MTESANFAEKVTRRIKMPEFCEKCGAIMQVKKNRKGKVTYICPICGWEKEVVIEDNNPSKFKAVALAVNIEKRRVTNEVIDESKLRPKGVLVDKICPKCGHSKAYVVIMQTRAADEPPTRIYRCEKCGYTWREYS